MKDDATATLDHERLGTLLSPSCNVVNVEFSTDMSGREKAQQGKNTTRNNEKEKKGWGVYHCQKFYTSDLADLTSE